MFYDNDKMTKYDFFGPEFKTMSGSFLNKNRQNMILTKNEVKQFLVAGGRGQAEK